MVAALAACGGGSIDGEPLAFAEEQPTNGGDPGRGGDAGSSGGLGDPSGGGLAGELEAGSSGEPQTCVSTSAQAIKPPIDLVISVDQSGSMNDDIANVKANVNKLAEFLKGTKLDFRVLMIASHGGPMHTSTYGKAYEVCVPPPLGGPKCGDPNPPLFRQINRNVQSLDTLKIILHTFDAADAKLAWKTDLRKDALKVFVPITDDDSRDYSQFSNTKCSPTDYADLGKYACNPGARAFDAALLGKAGGQFGTAASRNYVFYPIVGAAAFPSEKTCGANAVNNGQAYLDLAKLTKGRWFPICLKDFAPVFDQIAKDVASRVACELSIPPSPTGSIDHEKVNVSWTPGAGGRQKIAQDASKPCEGGANGWQYDAGKTKVLLCGKACADVRADAAARVDVEFGCRTEIR
jgi:hypothetical protein